MRERPILFSAPMVRAILAGTKTQTRRVVKPLPEPHDGWDWSWPIARKGVTTGTRVCWRADQGRPGGISAYCPYGIPGARLWVRETWAAHWMYDDVPPNAARSDREDLRATDNRWFAADRDGAPGSNGCPAEGRRGRWRPSIHMPRWASRITLDVVSVRVERVQEITEADARAEGARRYAGEGAVYESLLGPGTWNESARGWFAELWESINAKRGFGWDVNPWVWRIEFRRVKP